jgi:zinc transporter ZupT
MSWVAVPLAGLTVVATLIGGSFALRLHRELKTAIALSGGIVVAVALLDLIPEAFKAIGDERRVMTLVAAGFLLFFIAERFLVLHHRDEPERARAHEQVGALGAGALAFHTFTDGLGIGLAFGLNTETGILVLIAVISHDFADGINAVTFVLSQGGSRRAALRRFALRELAVELLTREVAEAPPNLIVRTNVAFVGVRRICRDLVGDSPHLARDGVAMVRALE